MLLGTAVLQWEAVIGYPYITLTFKTDALCLVSNVEIKTNIIHIHTFKGMIKGRETWPFSTCVFSINS